MKLFFAKNTLAVAACLLVNIVIAQPGTTIDLEKQKPEKYKEKLLKSEKTPEKKIGALKQFMGNMVTHYNYYYNANVKFNEIIEAAKESFTENYDKLLPFYNYSLNATAQDKNLDSIIYKTNAGILLHDLRTDWVDDMYMLLGKAYLLRKDFDSAYYVFQYLNYIYAPKDDGYDIPIGSNESNEEGLFSVSTNEKKRPFIHKLLLRKPLERNATFIWILRNYLEQRHTEQAYGLISILKSDPVFPKRLTTSLNEMTAYYYYLTAQYDSAGAYLEKSLGNAENRSEKGRWEFLIGQMYNLACMPDDAKRMYEKSIKHSTNTAIEVYANLNMLTGFGNCDKKSKAPQGDIDALLKLAKRERYASYRDIIYYAAGKIARGQNDVKTAADLFMKSAKSSVDNPVQKSKSYLALADAEYDLKDYKPSYSHYDSVKLKDIDSTDVARVNARKPALKTIVKNMDAIYLQDSLQALAKLAPKELNEILKKIYKKYKKAKGAKDDAENSFDFGSDNPAINNNTPAFSITDSKPGEFYFANESVKSQGQKDFRSKWGNRPNVDNWNRATAVIGKLDDTKKSEAEKAIAENKVKQNKKGGVRETNPNDLQSMDPNSPNALGNPDMEEEKINDKNPNSLTDKKGAKDEEEKEVTAESLYAAIPLTEEKLKASNDIIIEALFENGETFSSKLEDYPSAIAAYEELLRRFPKNKHAEQTIFNLSYCYRKSNKTSKEQELLQKLDLDFAGSDLAKSAKNKTSNSEKDEATKQYAGVYNMFLEGKYDEAKEAKRTADSVYKKKYWNPQLSFIESVYYIKQRQDSIAIDRLNLIVKGNAEKPLQEKAKIMIDVLKRRKQIEEYLSNLDSNGRYDSNLAKLNAAAKDSLANAKNKAETLKIDSSLIGKDFVVNLNEPHYPILLLDKVDDVFITETRKSFDKFHKEQAGMSGLGVGSLKLNQQYTLVLLGPSNNANGGLKYIDEVKPLTIKILPWLPAFKYTYSLIGITNLKILKANNNMDKYLAFLKKTFPGKF